MCVIVYKPQGKKMPKKETLRECFINNPDGAGYMYALNGKVHISKGFMKFDNFYDNLLKDVHMNGDDIPYVLHFRISTQAHGRPDCTHPYPLSSKMEDLRKLKSISNIGIAHNGIIDLTSSYGYKTTITYNDTMLFITDYLSLIINDNNYYKDKNKLKLIEKLCESKLAILDGNGHCELIGDFIEEDGIYYSNSSYKPYIPTYKLTNNFKDYLYGYDYYDEFSTKKELDEDYYYQYYNKDTDLYDFEMDDCPYVYEGEIQNYYCDRCSNQECPYSIHCIDYYNKSDNEDDNNITKENNNNMKGKI